MLCLGPTGKVQCDAAPWIRTQSGRRDFIVLNVAQLMKIDSADKIERGRVCLGDDIIYRLALFNRFD